MRNKSVGWAVRVLTVLVLALATGALAYGPNPTHFRGAIHDYTSASPMGPWETNGTWSLELGRFGLADFSAEMTMEFSDEAITEGLVNATNPGSRSPHTHHMRMKNATVSSDTSDCPVNNPPTTNPGFEVTGPVSITANGSSAPFEAKGTSTLHICVNGGSVVPYSNITLVLTGPATTHFGPQPIHGVVRAGN